MRIKPINNFLLFVCFVLITNNSFAASTYADTTIVNRIDSIVTSKDTAIEIIDTLTTIENTVEEDEAVDSTLEKRIYDSAYTFFSYPSFDVQKAQFNFGNTTTQLQKTDAAFWYMQYPERFKSNVALVYNVTDSATIDDEFINNNSKIVQKTAIDVHQLKTATTSLKGRQQFPEWLNPLLWFCLIAILIGAIAYFLYASGLLNFKNKGIATLAESQEVDAKNIFTLNYYKLFEEALQQKNYTQYIRLQYLQTLALLANKHIIQYQPDYTAFNYLQQLSATKYHKGFALVNLHYEYVWFGKFEVSESVFNTISNNISAFQQSIA